MSVLPSALRVSRVLAPLGVVASGFSLASLVGGRAEGPIAVAGLVVAILGMAVAWLLRRPWRAPATSGPNEGERRARIVGVGAVVVSLVGLILQLGRLEAAHAEPFAGTLLVGALAETGLLAGVAAIVTVRVRRWRRRAFIARVRAGKVPGYRVAANGARTALLRASADNAGYRAAEQEVYVFEKAP